MYVCMHIEKLKIDGNGLNQDLRTGCPKLAIIKYLGVLFFKIDHNILRL